MIRLPRTVRGIDATFVVALALSGVVACSLVRDVDALSKDHGTDAGALAEVGADAAGQDGAAPSCGGIHGPAMVPVFGAGFCIDATEVTGDQYRAFRAAVTDEIGRLTTDCAWYTSLAPEFDSPGELPITFVDLCDARAYCAWAGKRLCGRISGGALADANETRSPDDAWHRACTGGDAENVFPYGPVFVPGRCNGGEDAKTEEPRAVGAADACQGAVPGVFDLSGNVREWVDACEPGTSGSRACLTRGGAFYDVEGTLACGNRQTYPAETRNPGVGFRCCSR